LQSKERGALINNKRGHMRQCQIMHTSIVVLQFWNGGSKPMAALCKQ
jgi:hypothetical protein